MKPLLPRSEFHSIIDHPGSASVLGLNKGHEVLLIEYEKENLPYPVYEIPGGVIELHETPEQAARRELEEETGYTFDLAQFSYLINPSVGYSNEWISVFTAFVEKKSNDSEFEPQFYSKTQIKQLIAEGRIVDAQSLAALSNWVMEKQTTSLKSPDVLFLCTGNYYRSRFCEIYFNQLNQTTDLKAASYGLWAYRKINPDFISPHTVAYCQTAGIPMGKSRLPEQVEDRHFQSAKKVIALDEREHRPMMEDLFPEWADRIEYWNVHDIDFTEPAVALEALKQQVENLRK